MGYGRGSIDLDSRTGRYRIRIPDGRGGKFRVPGSWGTRAEAEAARQAALEVRDEKWEPGVTLEQYGWRWLDKIEKTGKRDIRNDRSRWNAFICQRSEFADQPIHMIVRSDIRDWVRSLMTATIRRSDGGNKVVEGTRTLNRKTIGKALGQLRRCLDEAVEDGYIETNPAKDVRVPRGDEAAVEEPWTFLTLNEIDFLLRCHDVSTKARTAFAICIYAGLRQGEVCGLRWYDVDLDSGLPHLVVRRSWGKAPKSGRSRTVPILPKLEPWLRTWRKVAPPIGPDGLLFADRNQTAHARGYDFGWEDKLSGGKPIVGARTRAGIERHVRFHDLRHTCASHLVMGSWGRHWRLEEIRELLGHTDVKTTLRYSHLSPDALHRAARETVEPINSGTKTGTNGKNLNAYVDQLRSSKPTVRGSNPLGRANDSGHLDDTPENPVSCSCPVDWTRSVLERASSGDSISDSDLLAFGKFVLEESELSDFVYRWLTEQEEAGRG